jgi:mono/diheme cytochrome c family protein
MRKEPAVNDPAIRTPAIRGGWIAIFATAAVLFADTPRVLAYESVLRFERDGALVREIDRATLVAECGVRPIVVEADPYYEKRKHFLACPIARVLELGFGAARGPVDQNYFFRARDGYMKPASGVRLAESGGWLALADLGDDSATRTPEEWDASSSGGDHRWEPLGRAAVDPGPFYLVWTGPDQADVHRYPWPYQLAAIEIAGFETLYPHTVPRGAVAGDPARAGFGIFRTECVSCHAINGEGGKVGPDLNIPRSIVEYRPAAQIKAFIRDPGSFRYTSMPSHLHLSARDLESLVSYFRAMKDQKFDPLAQDRQSATREIPSEKPAENSHGH